MKASSEQPQPNQPQPLQRSATMPLPVESRQQEERRSSFGAFELQRDLQEYLDFDVLLDFICTYFKIKI
jgi:hypothetical protein